MIDTVLEVLGCAALATLCFVGLHACYALMVARISNVAKESVAAKHVIQAIAEFKANHPEIAALYDKGTVPTVAPLLSTAIAATPAAPLPPIPTVLSPAPPSVATVGASVAVGATTT